MAKWRKIKGQTIIYKRLHRKLKIEQLNYVFSKNIQLNIAIGIHIWISSLKQDIWECFVFCESFSPCMCSNTCMFDPIHCILIFLCQSKHSVLCPALSYLKIHELLYVNVFFCFNYSCDSVHPTVTNNHPIKWFLPLLKYIRYYGTCKIFHENLFNSFDIDMEFRFDVLLLWSWGSWINNYLCNQSTKVSSNPAHGKVYSIQQ